MERIRDLVMNDSALYKCTLNNNNNHINRLQRLRLRQMSCYITSEYVHNNSDKYIQLNKKKNKSHAVTWRQGDGACTNDSLTVNCFRFRKVKSVLAPG